MIPKRALDKIWAQYGRVGGISTDEAFALAYAIGRLAGMREIRKSASFTPSGWNVVEAKVERLAKKVKR